LNYIWILILNKIIKSKRDNNDSFDDLDELLAFPDKNCEEVAKLDEFTIYPLEEIENNLEEEFPKVCSSLHILQATITNFIFYIGILEKMIWIIKNSLIWLLNIYYHLIDFNLSKN